MELSGTLGSSKRRWSNVHNDIKSTSVAWLMVFGMEGKRGGVLVLVRMETSGPPTGVAAGFSCPADLSTPAAGRGAGPSESSGSSKRNCELCDDSNTETSAGLSKSVSTTVVGPSTVTGPSPVAEPSPVAKPSPVAGPLPVAEPFPVAGPLPVAEPWSVVGSLPVTVPLRAAGPSLVAEPPLAAGPAPAEPSAAGAGTGTAGTDSIWICWAGEATTVIVRFSVALDFAGDSWTSRLATNVPPVLSELSRRLSRWLGWDLRSGDARDEDDERDRRSPEEWCWWWREEELDGRVSDAFETLPDSARLRELAPPEELGRARSLSPVAAVAVTAWLMPRRLVTFFFVVSSLAFRRPQPAVVRPVGAGRFHRRDAGSHGLGLRWTCDGLRPLGLGRILGLGTLGRKSVPRCVYFHRVVHHLSFLPRCFRRGSGLAAISLCCSLGLRCPSFWQPILTHETGTVLSAERQTIVQTTLLTAAVVIIPASEMGALRKLWLRFGWRRPVTWSFRHFLSQARKDVNKRLQNT